MFKPLWLKHSNLKFHFVIKLTSKFSNSKGVVTCDIVDIEFLFKFSLSNQRQEFSFVELSLVGPILVKRLYL